MMVGLALLVLGCATTSEPTAADRALLDAAAADYRRCVSQQLSRFAVRAPAPLALAEALGSFCRKQRSAIDVALAPFPEDQVEIYQAEVEAWTLEQVQPREAL